MCARYQKILVSILYKSANLAASPMDTGIWCSLRRCIVDFENQMYIGQSPIAYQMKNDYPMKSYSSNFTLRS